MMTGKKSEETQLLWYIRPGTAGNKNIRQCFTVLIQYCAVFLDLHEKRKKSILTLFLVWVCPMRIRALEEMIERQKLIRMTDLSDRIYLQENQRTKKKVVVTDFYYNWGQEYVVCGVTYSSKMLLIPTHCESK